MNLAHGPAVGRRVGYISPLLITEVFIKDFYMMSPPEVSLAVSTCSLLNITDAELATTNQQSLIFAREMANAGVDVVVFGGAPMNVSHQGFHDPTTQDALTALTHCVFTSSFESQQLALRAVDARRMAVVHPFHESLTFRFGFIGELGVEVLGEYGGAARTTTDLAKITPGVAFEMARQAMVLYPDADTVYFPGPHWAVSSSIERIENELEVRVVGAAQAIVWRSLALTGHCGGLEGYGTLLRDHLGE